jgi:hypothetical protein
MTVLLFSRSTIIVLIVAPPGVQVVHVRHGRVAPGFARGVSKHRSVDMPQALAVI